MTRVLWEGKGEWSGAYAEVLETPLIPPIDMTCDSIKDTADGEWTSCDEPAVAWRCDGEDEGWPWPACEEHSS